MEIRELVAYAILALMAAALIGAWLHLTRERRHHRRAYRRHKRQQAVRMMEEADAREAAG